MTFTTTQLANHRVVVKGTDVHGGTGTVIVDSTQWEELTARTDMDRAQQAFDDAVNEFFAPLEAAADALSKAQERPSDSTGYIVLQEATEGVPAQRAHIVQLTKDSQILRLIEEGNTDRLMWVGESLEITAQPQAAAQPAAAAMPSAAEVGAEATGQPLEG